MLLKHLKKHPKTLENYCNHTQHLNKNTCNICVKHMQHLDKYTCNMHLENTDETLVIDLLQHTCTTIVTYATSQSTFAISI
jgi:hypothetical protein